MIRYWGIEQKWFDAAVKALDGDLDDLRGLVENVRAAQDKNAKRSALEAEHLAAADKVYISNISERFPTRYTSRNCHVDRPEQYRTDQEFRREWNGKYKQTRDHRWVPKETICGAHWCDLMGKYSMEDEEGDTVLRCEKHSKFLASQRALATVRPSFEERWGALGLTGYFPVDILVKRNPDAGK